jgi:putative hydrolase of the HAD superfamily
MSKVLVIFDLDDTLYYEIDFLKSAYFEIANSLAELEEIKSCAEEIFEKMFQLFEDKENVFENIVDKYNISSFTVKDLISKYRNHVPYISLSLNTINILNYLKDNNIEMGIITDGRSKQQRSKINALGLDKYIKYTIISEEIGTEKPNLKNYKIIEDKFRGEDITFYYVGDNLQKDFVTPNKLGWVTVCLRDKGFNIHSQEIEVPKEYKPAFTIESMYCLRDIILGEK